jgi:hypothetical protein
VSRLSNVKSKNACRQTLPRETPADLSEHVRLAGARSACDDDNGWTVGSSQLVADPIRL